MQLDRNQEKAVKHKTGPAIVIAGPGSGKTTVITARILNLIQTHNIPPSRTLAIAFNRKAVEEMETRIRRELVSSKPIPYTDTHLKPKIRTLHAFGKDIIRDNYKRAGFSELLRFGQGKSSESLRKHRNTLNRKPLLPKLPSIKSKARKPAGVISDRPRTQTDVKKNTSAIHQTIDSDKQSVPKAKQRSISRYWNGSLDARQIFARHTGLHSIGNARVYLTEWIRCVCAIVTNSSLRYSVNTSTFLYSTS